MRFGVLTSRGFISVLIDSDVQPPRDLEPHLPDVLWFVQMGVIFFWVIDMNREPTSEQQEAPHAGGKERYIADSRHRRSLSPGPCARPRWNCIEIVKGAISLNCNPKGEALRERGEERSGRRFEG